MAHSTEVIGYEQPANNLFTLVVKCCGVHEHRHTIDPEVMNSEAKLASTVEWMHQQAAANHEAALQHKAKLEALKGAKVEHG